MINFFISFYSHFCTYCTVRRLSSTNYDFRKRTQKGDTKDEKKIYFLTEPQYLLMYNIFNKKYGTKCRLAFLLCIITLGHLANISVASKEDRLLTTPKFYEDRHLAKSDRGRSSRNHVKFIVKYKDHSSMVSSMSKSYSSIVTVENEISQYFISTLISNEETMKEIKNQDEVIMVEEDELQYSVGFIVEEVESGNSRRQLVEQRQFGIRMTEADQISSGNTKIGICVVDTGYG